jgi:hypothetical protein
MPKRLVAGLFGLCALLPTGCLHEQVATDGRDFRQAILAVYEQQAIDNLVRAANGQPPVHIDYRALTVTDYQLIKANVGVEHDPVGSETFFRQTAALAVSFHNYTNRLLFGGSASQDCQMQFHADPVTGNRDVYDYYMAFAHDPGLFCVSADEPAGPVYLKVGCGSRWYSVPADAGGVFLQLVLRTAFMRGPDRPPPVYCDATEVSVDPQPDKQGKVDRWLVRFDRPVKNDNGFALVTLADGTTAQVGLTRTSAPQGSAVTALTTQHAEAAKWADERTLNGRPAQVYAENYPNPGIKSPDAERLEAALANYRKAGRQTPAPPAVEAPCGEWRPTPSLGK